ncbi:hypothetical protein [Nocardia neocaledoniensis]|uniref:hypothetical protein n=1 Tax=Nocardia neocaledoniensis TaxID=236511 RepID=UPI002454811F|nr:hypothetical protein [Nocardia neocaledoniensis]
MFGQGKGLTAASETFANALPITAGLIAAAEAVVAAIDGEIEQGQRQIAQFRERDPNPGQTEIAIATRQGAEMALVAERSRWRKIVNVLREVPQRPVDPTGYGYFEGNPPLPESR